MKWFKAGGPRIVNELGRTHFGTARQLKDALDDALTRLHTDEMTKPSHAAISILSIVMLLTAGCTVKYYPQWTTGGNEFNPNSEMSVVELSGFEQRAWEPQRTPVWCWAACTAAALQHKGVPARQEDVATAVYGAPAVTAIADMELLRPAIQRLQVGDGHFRVLTEARQWITPEDFRNEIAEGNPFIVWYVTGPTSGHVILIYGALFAPSGEPIAYKVWDPMPNAGYRTIRVQQLSAANPRFMILKSARPTS